MLDWTALNAALLLARLYPPFAPTRYNLKLTLLVNLAWAAVSFWERKNNRLFVGKLTQRLFFAFKNVLYTLYLVAVVLVLLGVTGFSGYYIAGGFMIYAAFLTVLVIIDQLVSRREAMSVVEKPQVPRAVLTFAVADLFALVVSFCLVYLLKYNSLRFDQKALEVFLILSAVWLLTAMFTDKFRPAEEQNFAYEYAPFLKAGLIAAALMSVTVYVMRLFRYSRTLVFGSLLVLLLLEALLVLRRLIRGQVHSQPADIETAADVEEFLRQRELPVDPVDVPVSIPAGEVLKKQALADWPDVFEFLHSRIDLNSFDYSLMRITYMHSEQSVQRVAPQSLRLFVNLQMISEIRRPNEYFLQVHSKLKRGGYFLVRKERLENYRERLEEKYPQSIATALYVLHFFWHRMCPKLPFLHSIYEFVNGGRLKVMTRAEIMGRLKFCGFRMIDFVHIGDSHWFLVRKAEAPSFESNPSYGPLIALRRVGYKGRIFRLYKLRTMHPYAEFLQDYVHETQSLDESGKFKDDFRLTKWGKVLRRYWIDELPQFINYFRGDLRLFGVRAISEHYFSLYPPDLQKLRLAVKPGIIPPYYADMPKNFEEIIDSERRYLTAYLKSPLRTDMAYFFRAIVNILIKRARSH